MISRIALTLAAATLLATPAFAQDTAAPAASGAGTAEGTTMADTEMFVVNVPSSNAFEIQSSRLALEKASTPAVKTFAQRMIDDHTKAGAKFAEAVKAAGITPPGDSLNERHQAILESLSGATDNFDTAYMQAQLQAHREAVSLLSTYAEGGDNEPLKAFVEKTLPALKGHLAMVEEMTGGMTGSTTAAPGTDAGNGTFN